ncbi:MAG: hypothetical protein NC132_02760 [Corallococcus sp.]|nr:hypothetical protein [Corallococcus sp.]MCM1359030.1 hypothetical protein [Corallococcus sp.]MCM1395019.1 hypothetical protein [Corallococcus sp.]
MKTAFIGHRKVFAKNIEEKVEQAVIAKINEGCTSFVMGMHGAFDSIALAACRKLRRANADIEIEVVLTSLNAIKKQNEYDEAPLSDVKTVMYDVEEAHYKQRITLSNRQMIDECDTLICYVNTDANASGAKGALRYAKKRGLKIINLFRKEDQPFFGLTSEQANEIIDEQYKRIIENKQKDRD